MRAVSKEIHLEHFKKSGFLEAKIQAYEGWLNTFAHYCISAIKVFKKRIRFGAFTFTPNVAAE